ncbi:MAG: recombinase family protein [Thermoplasmata archaeon]
MRAAIYVRVSTDRQETEQQLRACRAHAEAKGWEVATVVEEYASAWKGPRPQWEALKKKLRSYEFQALIVFRIDRAWRRASEFVLDMEEFTRKNIAVVSIMEGIDASTPIGRAILQVIVAIAELERTAIAEATKQRLRALKNMGKKLGRPMKVNVSDEEIYARYLKIGTIRGTARALGVSVGKVHGVVRARRGA